MLKNKNFNYAIIVFVLTLAFLFAYAEYYPADSNEGSNAGIESTTPEDLAVSSNKTIE